MSEATLGRVARVAPLAGLAYAVLSLAGDLTIGPFPDSGTSISKLAAYYADHHTRVAAGGMLAAWSTLFLAVFGGVLWARVRRAGGPAVAAVLLVGTGAAVATGLVGASAYWILGHVSTEDAITPGALQAWHVAGSEGGLNGGVAIILLASAAAGLAWRAIPLWLAWAAVVLGLLQLTPLGFFASMLFLLWAAIAGVFLTLRPATGMRPAVAEPGTSPALAESAS